ncbi:hypothetical protein [Lysinibacillus sp. UGB7]|uniref:hypothetical protein n=1 Tax=Lysinibacillus sp. UGB7 TaxID=3411039 RepID=UPI003BA30DB9
MMKETTVNEKFLEFAGNFFNVHDSEDAIELESWTNGGVNMFIVISKNDEKPFDEQVSSYIEYFDVDEEVEIHREDQKYRDNFSMTESIQDFEAYKEWVEGILEQYYGVSRGEEITDEEFLVYVKDHFLNVSVEEDEVLLEQWTEMGEAVHVELVISDTSLFKQFKSYVDNFDGEDSYDFEEHKRWLQYRIMELLSGETKELPDTRQLYVIYTTDEHTSRDSMRLVGIVDTSKQLAKAVRELLMNGVIGHEGEQIDLEDLFDFDALNEITYLHVVKTNLNHVERHGSYI